MFSRNPSRPFDATPAGRRFHAAGPAGGRSEPQGGRAPSDPAGDDASAPERLPGGVEGESETEIPPRDHHARKSEGVEELKRMEENAEAGRD